jgi:hypothetical protein
MKKNAFFLGFVFLLSFSQCKKEPAPYVQTMYDLYPFFRVLDWESTNGDNNPLSADPQLSINIGYKSNEITLMEKIGATTKAYDYDSMYVSSTSVTFLKPRYKGSILREYTILPQLDTNRIKLSYQSDIYILKKYNH